MLELTRGTLSAPCCCAGRSPVPHLHVIVSPEPGSHAPSREHGIFLPIPFHAFQGRQRFKARACRQGGNARPSAMRSRGNGQGGLRTVAVAPQKPGLTFHIDTWSGGERRRQIV